MFQHINKGINIKSNKSNKQKRTSVVTKRKYSTYYLFLYIGTKLGMWVIGFVNFTLESLANYKPKFLNRSIIRI